MPDDECKYNCPGRIIIPLFPDLSTEKWIFSVIEANTRNRPALLSFWIAAPARSNALVYFSPSFFMFFFPGVRDFSPARYIVSRPKRISTVLA